MSVISRRGLLLGLAGMFGAGQLSSQTIANPPAALVVGISDYSSFPALPSAVHDARLIGETFHGLGFKVSSLLNPTREEFLQGFAYFQATEIDAPFTVIYLAAHGGYLAGQAHFFLGDAGDLADRIPETLLFTSAGSIPKQKVLFLDCCRDEIFSETAAPIGNERYRAGIFSCYACQPNAPAFDGGSARNSPFATALRNALSLPEAGLSDISRNVRLDVIRETNGLQIPWDRSSLLEPVYLNSRR